MSFPPSQIAAYCIDNLFVLDWVQKRYDGGPLFDLLGFLSLQGRTYFQKNICCFKDLFPRNNGSAGRRVLLLIEIRRDTGK
jgi:hypothetical protein